jgi:hypothetical protein
MHPSRDRLLQQLPTWTMSRWIRAVLLLGLAALLLMGVARAAAPTGPHILVLEDESAERPAYVGFMQGLREGLAPLGSAVVFTENLDLARFPQPEHLQRQSDWLKAKYRDAGIDIVVANRPRALT